MRAKLLIYYDVIPESQEAYYNFMTNEFLPKARDLGMTVTQVWHTAYGDYPMRLMEMVCGDIETIGHTLNHPGWQSLEAKLQGYVYDYRLKIVPLRDGFQM